MNWIRQLAYVLNIFSPIIFFSTEWCQSTLDIQWHVLWLFQVSQSVFVFGKPKTVFQTHLDIIRHHYLEVFHLSLFKDNFLSKENYLFPVLTTKTCLVVCPYVMNDSKLLLQQDDCWNPSILCDNRHVYSLGQQTFFMLKFHEWKIFSLLCFYPRGQQSVASELQMAVKRNSTVRFGNFSLKWWRTNECFYI